VPYYELKIGHQTGLVQVTQDLVCFTATLYWMPHRRTPRVPDEFNSTPLEHHQTFGPTEAEALESLRAWASETFESVSDFVQIGSP